MDIAHLPIVQAVGRLLRAGAGNVLDIGCGNGALLKRIIEHRPGAVPFGIDRGATAIAHARVNIPEFAANLSIGEIFETPAPIWAAKRQYDVVIVMPGRLLEVDRETADCLIATIKATCSSVVLYAYGDWITRYGDLPRLANAAGFSLVRYQTLATSAVGIQYMNEKERVLV
jgi:SAM-dependent methyltransferase